MALLRPVDGGRSVTEGSEVVSSVKFAPKTAMRRPPQFIEDLAGQGFASLLPSGNFPIQLEEPYCLKLEDVRVIGFRHIVTQDNYLLSDQFTSPNYLLNLIQNHYAPTYEDTDFVVVNGAVQSERIERVDITIDEPSILLTSLEPSNYGSLLFRVIPKIITSREYYLDDLRYFVYCPENPNYFRSLLNLSGISFHKITHHNTTLVYQFRELYVPGLRNAQAYLDHQTVQFYRSLVANLGFDQKPKRLLYVSRRVAGIKHPEVRFFMNETEFITELEKIGFEIIEAENLSSFDQIKKFAKARMILGPSGSGMFNAVFAPDESFFISIEAFPFWLHAHSNLPDSLGQMYGFIVGQPDLEDTTAIHKRWWLDVPQAIDRIRRVVASI